MNTVNIKKMEQNNKLPFNQVQILPEAKSFVPSLQQQILNGEVNPLQVNVFLKKIEKIGKLLTEGKEGAKVKEAILDEIHKFQEGKTARVFGAEIRESNRKYHDFSECNDPLWERLIEIKKEIDQRLKDREAELKLKVVKPGLGIPEVKISIDYMPELVIHDNTDLAIINPPHVGTNTIHSYYKL